VHTENALIQSELLNQSNLQLSPLNTSGVLSSADILEQHQKKLKSGISKEVGLQNTTVYHSLESFNQAAIEKQLVTQGPRNMQNDSAQII